LLLSGFYQPQSQVIMQILPTSGLLPTLKSDSKSGLLAAGDEFADSLASDDPADLLHEITQDGIAGLWKYQLEELKKKITEEVMNSHDVTEESLAAMAPEERQALQNLIEREIAEKLRQAIEEKFGTNGVPAMANTAVPQPAQTGNLLLSTQTPAPAAPKVVDPTNKLENSPFEDA
jgi:hypothetical protein